LVKEIEGRDIVVVDKGKNEALSVIIIYFCEPESRSVLGA